MLRPLALVVAAALVALGAGAAGATGPTTITFGEHPGGTVVDTEYAAQGVRFGKAADVGAPALPGAWDCGAPQVKEQTSDASPAPRLAQAPVCGGRSGTVAAFANPRKTIRLVVEATPSTDRQADVLAYAANGTLLTSARVSANRSPVAIDRAGPDVAYLALQLTGEGTSVLLFDDLAFDHLGDPLTLAPRGVGASVGVERTDNVARLTDADPTATAADYTVTIAWGDGQSSAGQLVASGDGYDVVGTHTYAATGTFSVQTTVTKVNGVRATTTSSARVVDRPDFGVTVTPGAARVTQGASASYTVAVSPLAGFTGNVVLSLSGATGAFAPATMSPPGTSRLTVTTTTATAPASYPLTITATSGSLSRTATATLTVAKGSPAVVAKLAAPSRASALSLIALDARGSTGASRYVWDVTGDRRPDVECGGSAPVLGVRSRTLGRRSVSVTAVSPGGSTSVATRTLGVASRPGQSGTTLGRSPEVAVCLRDARAYVEGRACAEKVVFGAVEAQGCFTHATRRDDVPLRERAAFDAYRGDPAQRDPLVARGPVKLNGISFVPSGGGAIVLFPQLERIVSSRAELALGGLRIRSVGPVNLALSGVISKSGIGKPSVRARLLSFTASTPLAGLGGFRPTGEADLSLVKRGSRYFSETKLSLALPRVFKLAGGSAPTGSTVMVADNARGLVLDELSLRVPEAQLGTIRMSDLAFEYRAQGDPAFNCPRRWWKATASVFLGSTGTDAGFRLAPDPPQNGIAFCDGAFKSAGGEVVFGTQIPPPQLFPGVYLTRIGFAIALDPTLVIGTGTVTSGGLFDVTGRLFMAFPSWSSPYIVQRGDVGDELGVLAGRALVGPTVAVGGTFKLRVPLFGAIPFANAYVAYSYPDYVSLGGAVRIPAPGFAINAGITGEMAVGRGLFDFHGYAEACIAGLACLVRADGWVTSTGVVVCGSIAGELHPGAGYRWGDAWPTIWLVDGCKPSRYWVNVRQQALGLGPFGAAATSTFTVARGERTKNVRIEGAGGGPRIEVRGPRGELVSTASGDYARGPTIRILRQDGGKVTWIGVENALPGSYTVTTLPGSVPIAGLAATRPVNDHVRATVTGAGSTRLLRYDVARVPGRVVTFFERGGGTFRRLGSTAGGAGRMRFTPGLGIPGMRQVVAQVRLDGIPAPDRLLGRFRVEAPPRAGRPARVALRRSGGAVNVVWGAAKNAERYLVVLRLRSGAQQVVRVPGGRRSVRLGGVPATQSGTVTVRAVARTGVPGPPAAGRFAARRALPSPVRPFTELRAMGSAGRDGGER